MNDPLADMKIEPVDADARPATEEEVEALHGQVPEWEIVSIDGIRRLRRTYPFPDFAGALEFANAVGALAEREWHHPEITIFHVENASAAHANLQVRSRPAARGTDFGPNDIAILVMHSPRGQRAIAGCGVPDNRIVANENVTAIFGEQGSGP